ncbi:hypothetical protein HZA99_02555 [Candidatus Woesearchaeota archaeon]|nr:hypothetical protein [Candidatus Woesearchaeota archaeon]
MNPTDLNIPENPRYDFFLTLLGIFMTSSSFYYLFISPVEEIRIVLNIALVAGYLLFTYGIIQMAERHKIENKLFIIKSFIQRKSDIAQLKREGIIDTTEEASLNVYLRDEILNYIEKYKK